MTEPKKGAKIRIAFSVAGGDMDIEIVDRLLPGEEFDDALRRLGVVAKKDVEKDGAFS